MIRAFRRHAAGNSGSTADNAYLPSVSPLLPHKRLFRTIWALSGPPKLLSNQDTNPINTVNRLRNTTHAAPRAEFFHFALHAGALESSFLGQSHAANLAFPRKAPHSSLSGNLAAVLHAIGTIKILLRPGRVHFFFLSGRGVDSFVIYSICSLLASAFVPFALKCEFVLCRFTVVGKNLGSSVAGT